ncbi:slipin family protein [Sulfitobacter sediminilitoris]|uniref:slipin family protein n=1 Tax=Sulfitobacter sediminilitoris TaxID=2698830 RepID=UPI003622808C
MTPPVFDLATYAILFLVIAGILASAIRILREYERGVLFTLGRFTKVSGPGLIIVIPVIQQIVRTDLRTFVEDVPSQDVISRDNVSVQVNAVIYFRIVDPERAIIAVENYREATSQLAQTTLRSVLGKHELDEMLAERDQLNADIQEILDKQTDAWGIKVANVEIKHVDIDESMVRAIARQAEAERQRRAKVINAEENGRPPRNWWKLERSLQASPTQCSCGIWKRCTISQAHERRLSFSRSPWICCEDWCPTGTQSKAPMKRTDRFCRSAISPSDKDGADRMVRFGGDGPRHASRRGSKEEK